MYVSNGNGYAVPVFIKSASTKETSRKDISDEPNDGTDISVEASSTSDDDVELLSGV